MSATPLADLVRLLAANGLPMEAIAEAVSLAEQATTRASGPVVLKDEAAERRREQDRNRKAQMRNNLRKSAEVCGQPPLSPLSLPQTPTQNPPIIPHSDTDVSAQAPSDFRSDLFKRGVEAVIAATGVPAPRARTLIGSWLKLAQDEAVIVLDAIEGASEARPADPIPWIRRTIESRMQVRAPPKRVWGSV